MQLNLRVLGAFSLSADDEPVEGLTSGAPTRLLAFLALQRTSRFRRPYLAGLFWPDVPEAKARRRLSHNLWILQTALADVAPSLVRAERETIGLSASSEFVIDAELFETLLARADAHRERGSAQARLEMLEQALGLYSGHLLADHYEEWIEAPRQRLRDHYLAALGDAVHLQKSRGDFTAAIATARRMVEESPHAESAHAELIRLYWLAGRADDAARHYEAVDRLLRDDFGVTPGRELLDLRERVQDLPAEAVRPASATLASGSAVERTRPELVGRSDERSRLLEVVDRSFSDRAGLAVVEGATGMGKTRLLQDVAEAAAWRGAVVVWANHRPDARTEPYGPITHGLGSVIHGLRREQVLARLDPEWIPLATALVPGLAGPGESPPSGLGALETGNHERWRVQEALAQVVLALCGVAPTVFILDGLHDCDPETLEFLRLAAPRLTGGRAAMFLSYRGAEARNRPELWQLLVDIGQRQSITRAALGSLSRQEVQRLAADVSGEPISEVSATELHAVTGGVPLFVIETVRSARRDGLPLRDVLARSASMDNVAGVLLAGLDSAPPVLRQVVSAMALWPGAASSQQLTRITGLGRAEVLDAVGAAIDAELAQEAPEGGYQLRFDQLASAARSRIDADMRRELHGRIADLLSEDPTVPYGELAAHYRAAEAWPQAAVNDTAAAARAANLHSYDAAATFFERALEAHAAAGEAPPIDTLFAHESVLDLLGRRSEQASVLKSLESRDDLAPRQQLELLSRRALQHAATDQFIDAVEAAAAAIGFATAIGVDHRSTQVTMAKVFVLCGHPDLARAHLEDLDDDADTPGQASAELALGITLTDVAEWDAALGHLQRAVTLFRSHDDTRGEVEALAAMAVLHSQTGESAVALRHYQEAITLARQIGHRFGEAMALANLAALRYLLGDAATALAHMGEAAGVFTAIGHRRGEATIRANRASILHMILGDDDEAQREAAAARQYFEEIGDRRHEAQALDVLTGIRRRRRAFAVSRRVAAAALEACRGGGDQWLEIQLLRSLAWTEYEADTPDRALETVDEAIRLADQLGLDTELPTLLGLRAASLGAAGRIDEASATAHRSRASEVELEADQDLGHVTALWRARVHALTGDLETERAEIAAAHERLQRLLTPFPADVRDRAERAVAEHAEIIERHALHYPKTQLVYLAPEAEHDGEKRIPVRWTIHHPDDLDAEDRTTRRRQRLARLIDEARGQRGHPRLVDLAEALDTSVSTLKRDMASLRADGRL